MSKHGRRAPCQPGITTSWQPLADRHVSAGMGSLVQDLRFALGGSASPAAFTAVAVLSRPGPGPTARSSPCSIKSCSGGCPSGSPGADRPADDAGHPLRRSTGHGNAISYPMYEDLAKNNEVSAGCARFPTERSLAFAVRRSGYRRSWSRDLLLVLGVGAALGRTLHDRRGPDGRPSARPTGPRLLEVTVRPVAFPARQR
jgi:hypothetical protein